MRRQRVNTLPPFVVSCELVEQSNHGLPYTLRQAHSERDNKVQKNVEELGV